MPFLPFSERFPSLSNLFSRQLDNSFAQVDREFRKKSSNVRFFNDARIADQRRVLLPFGVDVPDKVYYVVKTDPSAFAVTIFAYPLSTPPDTIEGQPTLVLPAQYSKAILVYDGGVWYNFY